MGDWKAVLKADPTDWLLEEDNPSVRYFALTDLLDLPGDDARVCSARKDIMQTGMVPQILEKQREPGYRKGYPGFYTRKYTGLVWSLIVLAELYAQANEEIREQCEYILSSAQEVQEGGFSMHEAVKTGGGRRSEVIPCLTGNMVWSLSRLGYGDDPRLQKGISWLVQFMRYNDGVEENPQVPPYNKYEMCWGKHTCHMGVVKALKALSEVPKEKRTPGIEDTIRAGVEFMLIHHIHKQSHNLKRTAKPGWLKFGFPMMYQTDVLEILDILTALGVKDNRMEEAVQVVLGKQDDLGRWRMENTYLSDRVLVPFGQEGEPSKWLTLRALRVLKRYGTE